MVLKLFRDWRYFLQKMPYHQSILISRLFYQAVKYHLGVNNDPFYDVDTWFAVSAWFSCDFELVTFPEIMCAVFSSSNYFTIGCQLVEIQ